MTDRFQNPDSLVFFLRTTNQYLDMFSDDELDTVCCTLNSIRKQLHENPALHTSPVLDALHAMGFKSAYQDLGYHDHTPRQEASLQAIKMLGRIARSPNEQTAQLAINHLDDIITNSMDYDLRYEAARIFYYRMEDNDIAAALLEKQAAQNSSAGIRQACREGLIHIAANYPDMTECALAALVGGMNGESDLKIRERCIALLTNRVRSTTCDADELPQLREVFSRAAIDHGEHETILYWAKKGMAEVDERIRTNAPGEFKFP